MRNQSLEPTIAVYRLKSAETAGLQPQSDTWIRYQERYLRRGIRKAYSIMDTKDYGRHKEITMHPSSLPVTIYRTIVRRLDELACIISKSVRFVDWVAMERRFEAVLRGPQPGVDTRPARHNHIAAHHTDARLKRLNMQSQGTLIQEALLSTKCGNKVRLRLIHVIAPAMFFPWSNLMPSGAEACLRSSVTGRHHLFTSVGVCFRPT
jgi:hypothetical protein